MKTFKDLKFGPHGHADGVQALCFFPNGFGVSVVRFKLGGDLGYGSYTTNEKEWELAVLKGSSEHWNLTYQTPVTDDVIGHLSEDGVTDIMKKVQELETT